MSVKEIAYSDENANPARYLHCSRLPKVINDRAVPDLPPLSSPALRRAAEMCLKHDPAARPTIAEARA